MNAAARTLSQGSLFRGDYKFLSVSRQSFGVFIVIFAVLLSAIAVIYVKNLDRRLFSQLETQHQLTNQLQVEFGQLLLEQSTWATPSRVQRIAQQRYAMELPLANQVAMVKL